VADEPLNQSIVSSIDGQLSAKGLTKVSPGENPDVLVSYGVVFDRNIRGMGFRDGLRNLRWRSGSHDVLMGMLVVNLVDSGKRLPFLHVGHIAAEHLSEGAICRCLSWRLGDSKVRRRLAEIFRSGIY
jgi:hypothetical protein